MVRLAGINENDIVNGEDVCVSVFLQGCPHRCKGCHNPETWSFTGGNLIEDENKEINNILKLIKKNNIQRNLSILGGEPFWSSTYSHNAYFTMKLLAAAKEKYPNIKTFVWSGYTLEQLKQQYGEKALENIDVLIDGPFIQEERDITLKLRGSLNQRVLYKHIDF